MSLSIERFNEFFLALWGYDPFPWQTRLAKQVFKEGWPDCVDLPTASGKTAAIDIAIFVLACQAELETNKRTVGRRIFFTVNRRVIVDEAFDRAKSIAQKLIDAKEGILKEVADALHDISGDKKAPPLDVAQLRGGVYRDRAWARSITQPIVVCTTADQLGSRLLFRGYGVTASSAPIHAALCGCDSLVLLDEAHVTRAFSQTMQLLTKYQQVRTGKSASIPPMRFVQMTATPAGQVKNRFGLGTDDRLNLVLKVRQEASKSAALIQLNKKTPIVDTIVTYAFNALSDTRKAVGIVVNRVQTARDVQRLIQEEIDKRSKKDENFSAEVHLVIGRMRPIDRDDLQERLRALVGPDRPDVLDNPAFIVATQCLEVGADYDFDALITECASIDALRQRFGRLNRKGRPVDVSAAIVTNEESLKGEDPIYGDAIKHTWEWLWSKKSRRDQIDFGISGFKPLWDEVERDHVTFLDENAPKRLLSPTQNAAVLLPAHLDALCQTNPQPAPSPDVSYFIHGPQRDNAEVNVCWRADFSDGEKLLDQKLWPDIVRLLPPTSPECMTVPLRDVRRWMIGTSSKDDRDADVPVQAEPDEKKSNDSGQVHRPVVVWRGTKGVTVIDSANELRPNDTVVMPIEYRNWNSLGYIPNPQPSDYDKRENESLEDREKRCLTLARSIDVAEQATHTTKRRVALRIHPAFKNTDSLRGLSDSDLRKSLADLGIIDVSWTKQPVACIEHHSYPSDGNDNVPPVSDEVIVFKRIDSLKHLVFPCDEEDDGEDNLSERDQRITLDKHNNHVARRIAPTLDKLHLNGLERTVRVSAPLHDLGKSDIRFNAMLAGITPFEAMMCTMLAKGDGRRLTNAEKAAIRARAQLPTNFRHEMLSMQIVEHRYDELIKDTNIVRDLLLHLIAAHHGYARPFAPVVIDTATDETRSIEFNGITVTPEQRQGWGPSHRLDSGIAERFWNLTREHGWWGLAWLESILRLADQQASAAEQE